MANDVANSWDPEDLLSRARAGDEQALGMLLQRYRNYLRVLTRLRLGEQLQAKLDDSDLIQETWVRACAHFADFRGHSEAELLGWLRQILARTLANAQRHYTTGQRNLHLEQRLVQQLEDSSQTLQHRLVDSASSPSEKAARREQVVRLADALEQLPEPDRQVLLLRHVKGWTFPRIAQELERSQASVEKRWARALARLRGALRELP